MHPQQNPVQPGYAAASSLTASAAPSPAASVAGAFQADKRKKPITYNGVTYPTQRALADAMGLAFQTVSHAIRRGRLHRLGMGKTAEGIRAIAREVRCQPVSAHGWHWPSQKAAAREIGVSETTLCQSLARGTFARLVKRKLGVKHA